MFDLSFLNSCSTEELTIIIKRIKELKDKKVKTKKDTYIEILSDLEFHCTICSNKILGSGQEAKIAQNIRDEGYVFISKGTRYTENKYCKVCEKSTCHRKLVSLEKKENINVRNGFSNEIRNRISKIFKEKDNFELSSAEGLEIDHRIPPYVKEEYVINEKTTDNDLSDNYQLLTKRNNYIKREACNKCKDTHKRGIWSGIHFFYTGNENYEGTCEGCFYAYPEKWREALSIELHRK